MFSRSWLFRVFWSRATPRRTRFYSQCLLYLLLRLGILGLVVVLVRIGVLSEVGWAISLNARLHTYLHAFEVFIDMLYLAGQRLRIIEVYHIQIRRLWSIHFVFNRSNQFVSIHRLDVVCKPAACRNLFVFFTRSRPLLWIVVFRLQEAVGVLFCICFTTTFCFWLRNVSGSTWIIILFLHRFWACHVDCVNWLIGLVRLV